MNNELNKKLAEWAGFKCLERHTIGMLTGHWHYIAPDGSSLIDIELPNFTQSLDACFKWFPDIFHAIEFVYFPNRAEAIVWHQLETYIGEAPKKQEALALCLAIEKLIDEEANNG